MRNVCLGFSSEDINKPRGTSGDYVGAPGLGHPLNDFKGC